LIEEIHHRKGGETVNILTHCNAGWLATVDFGTATAPIYAAFDRGLPIHVWVDETRPRNQGARLTTWELSQHGVPNTLITDNAGGHLMQHGMVDLVITGSDRTLYRRRRQQNRNLPEGRAARDCGIPFTPHCLLLRLIGS
jgi:methylthioribose-1-phosphate isomerase